MSDQTASDQLSRRYITLALFMLALGAALTLLEVVLRAAGSPFLLTQRSGPGQVALYSLSALALVLFSQKIAGVSTVRFAWGYLRDWRRFLAGFFACWLFATAIMVVIHLVMVNTGSARFSWEAANNFGWKVFASTVAAMAVMLILVLFEELIFRAFLVRYLRPSTARGVTIAAVLVAAVIFSSLHTVSLGDRLQSDDLWQLLFGLFMLGVLLGTTYVVTGSLGCSMGIHAGLLGFKVFLRKTHLIEYAESSAMGGSDLRTGPLVWFLMGLTTLAFIIAGRWLYRRYAVETVVGQPVSVDPTLGFLRR